MRVLIVEDDEMIGESLVRGLSDEGYAVDWVRDGEHAQEALQAPQQLQAPLLRLRPPFFKVVSHSHS